MLQLKTRLSKQLDDKCNWLEKCTDTCKGEEDMVCINKCGDKFMSDLHKDFKTSIKGFMA